MRTGIVILILSIIVVMGVLAFGGYKLGLLGKKVTAINDRVAKLEKPIPPIKTPPPKVVIKKNGTKPPTTQPTPRLNALEEKGKEQDTRIVNLEQANLKFLVAVQLEEWNRKLGDQKIREDMATGFGVVENHLKKDGDPFNAQALENFLLNWDPP